MGRHADICRLAARLDGDINVSTLQRVAMLCTDIDQLPHGGQSTAAEVLSKYQAFCAASPLEKELLERFYQESGKRPTPNQINSILSHKPIST